MPGKQIVVDVECELFETCINDWFPQPGDDLELEFKCCAIPCSNDWEDFAGDALVLDATEDRSCDRSWFDVPGNSLDFDFACCPGSWTDEPGNSLVFDFLCPGDGIILDVPACDSSCPGTWYPQPGDNLDIEYVCCGTSEGGAEIILSGLVASEGQTFEFDYTSDKLFVPSITEGQTLTAILTAPQNITFPVVFDSGETANVALRTAMVIPVDMFTGEEHRFLSFNVYPSILMSANGYEGQTLTGGLYTSSILAVSYQIGETLTAALDTRPSQFMVVTFDAGETLAASIITHRLFPITFQIGEQIAGELTTEPYEGIQSVFAVGESLTASVDAIPGFIIRMYAGEEVAAMVNTTAAFPISFTAGESLSAAMYQAQYWNPEPTAYAGETMETGFSVGRFSLGVIVAETGEELNADLKTNEKAQLVANGQHGETATVSISWAANLGNTNFYHGTTAVVDTLEFDSLYRAYEGARLDVTFATQTTMPGAAFEGARLNIDLTTGPSEPLGRLNAWHGEEHTVQTLALLKAVFLGVTFYNSYMFHVGAPYIGTFMDMDSGCCANHYPGQQDFHKIEMNDAEFGDQKFDGDRIRATVDFQTQPRFRFNFTHGETLRAVEDNTFLIYPRMNTGETLHVTLESNHINFPLCPVNFIPDGDNVYVELDYIDDTSCYADYFHTGENCVVHSFQVNQNFQERYYEGARMDMELTLRDAWVLRAYTGETARVSNPEMELNTRTGESMALSFYVPPIIGATGEHVEANLTTIYEVVFLEDGCLDNEYIWQDENGDPIPEKFNPVPVELDPFQHDIKARCQ